MRSLRLVLSAAGLLAAGLTAAAAAPAVTPPKVETYAVVGFVDGAKPSPELIERASREVAGRMKDRRAIADPEEADHLVQVLFKRGTYRIYVDALPLGGIARQPDLQRYLSEVALASEMARERAEGSNSRR